jgi:hypothetical protein
VVIQIDGSEGDTIYPKPWKWEVNAGGKKEVEGRGYPKWRQFACMYEL